MIDHSLIVGHLQRLMDLDLYLCLRFNQAHSLPTLATLFGLVSRLGDGIFWYSLMIMLLLFGDSTALSAVEDMLLCSIIGLAIYKWLKAKTIRARPFAHHQCIRISVAPLDQYSFPSGHTLHAVGFSIIASHYFPALAWLLAPFAILVGLSRMVLGLHYPSDVIAGALLGSSLATLVLIW